MMVEPWMKLTFGVEKAHIYSEYPNPTTSPVKGVYQLQSTGSWRYPVTGSRLNKLGRGR
jgi:hypothetical protein